MTYESAGEIRFLSRSEPDKLPGGVVIEGFPESGLAGTIGVGNSLQERSILLRRGTCILEPFGEVSRNGA
jgi:hypothetical protein